MILRQSMTNLLDGLEKRALLRREIDPEDRRRIRVSLLPEGEALAVQLLGVEDTFLVKMGKYITDDERRQFRRLERKMYEMPFAFSSPEWGNEKGIDAALGFRLNGISSYHCVEAPIHGSKNVIEFLKHGTLETLGSSMNVDTDPVRLGEKIVGDMKAKRRLLGWDR